MFKKQTTVINAGPCGSGEGTPTVNVALSTANTGAENAALVVNALRQDGVAVLPAGGPYAMELDITHNDLEVGGVAKGAKIILTNTILSYTNGTSCFKADFTDAVEGPFDVAVLSGRAEVYDDLIPATGNTASYGTSLTLDGLTEQQVSDTFQVHRAIHFSSNDKRTYFPSNNTNFLGLISRISHVDAVNRHVYLSGSELLAFLATTSPQVRLLPTTKFSIAGSGEIRGVGTNQNSNTPAIELIGLDSPYIGPGLRLTDIWAIGIRIQCTANYLHEGLDLVSRGTADVSNFQLGYAEIWSGANYSPKASGGTIRNWRHITTDGPQGDDISEQEWYRWGDVTYPEWTDITASECEIAFDSHEPTYRPRWVNCRAVNNYRNPLITNNVKGRWGNTRGYGGEIISSSAHNCIGGVQLYNAAASYEDLGSVYRTRSGDAVGVAAPVVRIDGFSHTGTMINNVTGYGIEIGSSSAVTGVNEHNIEISNYTFVNGSKVLSDSGNYTGTITIRNSIFQNFFDIGFRLFGSGTLRMVDSIIDGSSRRASSEEIFRIEPNGDYSVYILNCTYIGIDGTDTQPIFETVAVSSLVNVKHHGFTQLNSTTTVTGGAGTNTVSRFSQNDADENTTLEE